MPVRKPKVAAHEKEKRLQEIRNRVPKVIVELIIAFVPLNNFQTMKSIIEGYYPFHKVVFNIGSRKNWQELPRGFENFLSTFQIVGNSIQNKPDNYTPTIVAIEKIIAHLQENLHSKRKVFYTWKLEEEYNEKSHKPLWGKLVCELLHRFYVMKHAVDSEGRSKRYFFMDETKTEHKVLFNMTINASGQEDKKEVINFFKGFGAFVDWMRRTAPIKNPWEYDV